MFTFGETFTRFSGCIVSQLNIRGSLAQFKFCGFEFKFESKQTKLSLNGSKKV